MQELRVSEQIQYLKMKLNKTGPVGSKNAIIQINVTVEEKSK